MHEPLLELHTQGRAAAVTHVDWVMVLVAQPGLADASAHALLEMVEHSRQLPHAARVRRRAEGDVHEVAGCELAAACGRAGNGGLIRHGPVLQHQHRRTLGTHLGTRTHIMMRAARTVAQHVGEYQSFTIKKSVI